MTIVYRDELGIVEETLERDSTLVFLDGWMYYSKAYEECAVRVENLIEIRNE